MPIAPSRGLGMRDHDTGSSDYAIDLIGNNASGDDLDDTHGFLPGAVVSGADKATSKKESVGDSHLRFYSTVLRKTKRFFRKLAEKAPTADPPTGGAAAVVAGVTLKTPSAGGGSRKKEKVFPFLPPRI